MPDYPKGGCPKCGSYKARTFVGYVIDHGPTPWDYDKSRYSEATFSWRCLECKHSWDAPEVRPGCDEGIHTLRRLPKAPFRPDDGICVFCGKAVA